MRKTQQELIEHLSNSTDMDVVQGDIVVDVPADVMWEFFTNARLWPRWNPCFFWAYNKTLVLGKKLVWIFKPIKWHYLYVMPASANIVELEFGKKVTWEVTVLPGFYARHTYSIEDLGNGKCRFSSWEKATGWSFRLMKKFWINHFEFVKNKSLEGAKHVESVYHSGKIKRLKKEYFAPGNYSRFYIRIISIATLLVSVIGLWFYVSYIKFSTETLAEGIHAVYGGGGNSLVIESGNEIILVDTKFPPGSDNLKDWLEDTIPKPVTHIINTHYHYDHTEGNILYPDASIYAHDFSPSLMKFRDGNFWRLHKASLPLKANLVHNDRALEIEDRTVNIVKIDQAHTQSDLVVILPKENIVALGDLMFHTYYPFMDLGHGGMAPKSLTSTLKKLANKYPDAKFLPGHGPLASAKDVHAYADYINSLENKVATLKRSGKSKKEVVRLVEMDEWSLSILPSFHDNKLSWATQKNNIEWMYDLIGNQ